MGESNREEQETMRSSSQGSEPDDKDQIGKGKTIVSFLKG